MGIAADAAQQRGPASVRRLVPLHVVVDEEQRQELDRRAFDNDRSVSAEVRTILRRYLDDPAHDRGAAA